MQTDYEIYRCCQSQKEEGEKIMNILFLVLLIAFVCILIFAQVVNILQRKRRKVQVAEFLAKCNEEQLKFINEYDACYKVNFGDIWKKSKKKK